MIPTRSDLTLTRGDYFERYYRFETFVWDPAAGDDGEYVSDGFRDLTGIVFNAQIRADYDETVVLAEFSFTVGDQTDPDEKGGFLMWLSGADAALIPLTTPEDKHVWDLQMTYDDKPETRFAGKVTVKPDVTRPEV